MEAQPQLIIQGISSIDELVSLVKKAVREELTRDEEEAARILGVTRATIYNRMKVAGIECITTKNINLLKR